MGEFPKNPIENSSGEEKMETELIKRKKSLLAEIKGLYGNQLVELAKNTRVMAHDEILYADNVDDVNKLLGRFEKDIESKNPSELGFIETQLRQLMEKEQGVKERGKTMFNKLFKK